MLVIRGKILGFLLLFVLVTGNLSNAYLFQGGDKLAAGKCKNIVSKRSQGPIEGTENKDKIRGQDYIFARIQKKAGEIVNKEKVQEKHRMLMPRESYRARFVGFVADYKGPRHHPPKNN